jgi:hypothetical protein
MNAGSEPNMPHVLVDPVPEIQREVARIVEEDGVEGRLQERRLATKRIDARGQID